MDLTTIKNTEIFLTWGISMRKGQITILLIGILMAVTLGVMGFFARNQVDEIELQRMGIDSIATSVCVQQHPAILNFKLPTGE